MRHRVKDLICHCISGILTCPAWIRITAQDPEKRFSHNSITFKQITFMSVLKHDFISQIWFSSWEGHRQSIPWALMHLWSIKVLMKILKRLPSTDRMGKSLCARSLSQPSAAADRLGKQNKPESAPVAFLLTERFDIFPSCMQFRNTYFTVIAL